MEDLAVVYRMRRFLLAAAVSAGLVAYLLHRVAVGRILAAVAAAPLGPWAAAVAIYLAAQAISARRWAFIARAAGFEASQLRFLGLYFEGMFFNLCLPTSIGGDAVKSLRLGENASRRLVAAATVLIDRAAGLTALVALGAGAGVDVLLVRQGMLPLPAACLGSTAGFLAIIVAAAAWRLGGATLRHIPKMNNVAAVFAHDDKRNGMAARVFLLSLVVQLLNAVVVGCVGTALRLDVPYAAYVVVATGVALVSMLPISVGGIGVREASTAALLAYWGVGQGAGVALGILWFSVMFASGLTGGLVYLFNGRMRAARVESFCEHDPGMRKAA